MKNLTKYFNYNNAVKVVNATDGIVWGGVSIAIGLGLIHFFLPFKKKPIVTVTAKQENKTDIYTYTYADAVESISNSNINGTDKVAAIGALEYGLGADIYKAVCEVMDSNMLGPDKVEAIKTLGQKRSQ